MIGLAPIEARAQGSVFLGRVLSDSGMVLARAEVVLNGPHNLQRTNDSGHFRFSSVPPGFQIVGVRMPGFAPRVDTIEVAEAGEVRREYRLTRVVAELPEVSVRTTLLDRKLFEFSERRKFGMGRFLDSAEFAKAHGTRTSDKLAKLSGVIILRGRGMDAYVTSNRGRCPSNVWLDNLNIGTGFNVNELDPSSIAAVEWYSSTSLTPARFSVIVRRSGVEWSAEPATHE
jgi:hypothetical protein